MRTPVPLDWVKERPGVLGLRSLFCAGADVFPFEVENVMNSFYDPRKIEYDNCGSLEICTWHESSYASND